MILDKPPLCTICWEVMDEDEEFFLQVTPVQLERSRKSGRVRVGELEFALPGNLAGHDQLYWHYECLVELLQDPSVVGKTYR